MTYKEIWFFSKKIEKKINEKYILLDMKITNSNYVFLAILIFIFIPFIIISYYLWFEKWYIDGYCINFEHCIFNLS